MIGDFFVSLLDQIELTGSSYTVAEVGVKAGRTSKRLLQEPNIYLYMIDPWQSLPDYVRWDVDKYVAYFDEAMDVTDFAKDRRRVQICTSAVAVATAQSHGMLFDLVILDANHSYEHVKFDVENWFERLRVGGIMSGRFYGKIEGVTQAVDEFILNNKIVLTRNGKHGWYFFKEDRHKNGK